MDVITSDHPLEQYWSNLQTIYGGAYYSTIDSVKMVANGDAQAIGRATFDIGITIATGGSAKISKALSSTVRISAVVDVRKFSEYIFKEGATHGKEVVFASLGYSKQQSNSLMSIYQRQAAEKYAKGEYTLGTKDQYGQRINIEIVLQGIGNAKGKTSYINYLAP